MKRNGKLWRDRSGKGEKEIKRMEMELKRKMIYRDREYLRERWDKERQRERGSKWMT